LLERKKNSLGLAAGERDVIRRSVPLQFHCQRTANIHVCVCVCVCACTGRMRKFESCTRVHMHTHTHTRQNGVIFLSATEDFNDNTHVESQLFRWHTKDEVSLVSVTRGIALKNSESVASLLVRGTPPHTFTYLHAHTYVHYAHTERARARARTENSICACVYGRMTHEA